MGYRTTALGGKTYGRGLLPLSLSEWRIESGKAAAAATDAEFYGPTAGLCVPTERRPRPAFAFGSREGKRERQTADLSRERGGAGQMWPKRVCFHAREEGTTLMLRVKERR